MSEGPKPLPDNALKALRDAQAGVESLRGNSHFDEMNVKLSQVVQLAKKKGYDVPVSGDAPGTLAVDPIMPVLPGKKDYPIGNLIPLVNNYDAAWDLQMGVNSRFHSLPQIEASWQGQQVFVKTSADSAKSYNVRLIQTHPGTFQIATYLAAPAQRDPGMFGKSGVLYLRALGATVTTYVVYHPDFLIDASRHGQQSADEAEWILTDRLGRPVMAPEVNIPYRLANKFNRLYIKNDDGGLWLTDNLNEAAVITFKFSNPQQAQVATGDWIEQVRRQQESAYQAMPKDASFKDIALTVTKVALREARKYALDWLFNWALDMLQILIDIVTSLVEAIINVINEATGGLVWAVVGIGGLYVISKFRSNK